MEALTSSSEKIDSIDNEQSVTRPNDKADVVIVSAYGRGHWLASELVGRGWKATLLDVSSALGPWPQEDCEGPFGFFETSDLFPSQKKWILNDSSPVTLEDGFVLWLKDGPLECSGALTAHQIKRREIEPVVESYLRSPGLPGRESEKKRSWLLTQPFRRTWLAHFAHQVTSVVSSENHQALERGRAAPLFAPFILRQVSEEGHRKSLEALEMAGVKVVRVKDLSDVRMGDKKEVDAIVFQGSIDESSAQPAKSASLKSGSLKPASLKPAEKSAAPGTSSSGETARWFSWHLSPHETQSFPTEVYTRVFPNGAPDFDWFWARFEVELGGDAFFGQVPPHVVLVEDIYLPWTHANCMVLRRKTNSSAFDVWAKVPARVRGDRSYLSGIGVEIEKVLGQRLPQSGPRVSRLPFDIENTQVASLAPKFPVYAPGALQRHSAMKAANMFFCGPETWGSLDWLGAFRRQNEVLTQIEKLRLQFLAAEEKRAKQEAKIAAQKAAKKAAQDKASEASAKAAANSTSNERPGPQA